ncbi:unnamed protein product [Victoria cruziana]
MRPGIDPTALLLPLRSPPVQSSENLSSRVSGFEFVSLHRMLVLGKTSVSVIAQVRNEARSSLNIDRGSIFSSNLSLRIRSWEELLLIMRGGRKLFGLERSWRERLEADLEMKFKPDGFSICSPCS